MNTDELLKRYYAHFRKKEWASARDILAILLEAEPDSFWLNTCMGAMLYELREYRQAEQYAIKAYTLNPESPLVLWDYAGILYMLERFEEAIEKWERILGMGEDYIAYEITTEGRRWARSLINDTRFSLGQSYYQIDQDELALGYFEDHLKHRARGLRSLYSKREGLKWIKKVKTYLED